MGSSCESRAQGAGATLTSGPRTSAGSGGRRTTSSRPQLRGALCLAYPSLLEGFGIPVLEAMLCGTPVVTSERSAMEEVAGGAAELVDPRDVESIAAGIERALARRDELRAAGLVRAQAFTWESSAEATVQAYRKAVA